MLRLGGWKKDEDILLVRMLDGFASDSGLRTRHSVMAALRICASEISEQLQKIVTVSFLVSSLAIIRRRYRKFKEFLAKPGVCYAVRRNRVYARELYWNNLGGKNETIAARTMRTRGEPMYPQLRNIFTTSGCFTLPAESSVSAEVPSEGGASS